MTLSAKFYDGNAPELKHISYRLWKLENARMSFGLVLSDGRSIFPADGFETDLASIPDVFTCIYPKEGRKSDQYAPAAVIHDYLYFVGKIADQWITQEEADNVMEAAMEDNRFPVKPVTRSIFLAQLAQFGHYAWNAHDDGRQKSSRYSHARSREFFRGRYTC